MPRSGSERFVVPSQAAQQDWGALIHGILLDGCADVELPIELAGCYELFDFVDHEISARYCVLMEVGDANGDLIVDRGWGTYIYYPDSPNDLHVQIPHPLFDLRTDREGIGVFKGTGARSFQMSGAHRYSNTTPSPCQPNFPNSDPAHNSASMFRPATEALLNYYGADGEFLVVQFHGMAVTSCPGADVFLTYGTGWLDALAGPLADLRATLQARHPDWIITVPGDPLECHLNGGNNMQARRINGVPDDLACFHSATEYSQRFIHIEQKIDFRLPSDWIDAIKATAPVYRPQVPVLDSFSSIAVLLALFTAALIVHRRT